MRTIYYISRRRRRREGERERERKKEREKERERESEREVEIERERERKKIVKAGPRQNIYKRQCCQVLKNIKWPNLALSAFNKEKGLIFIYLK